MKSFFFFAFSLYFLKIAAQCGNGRTDPPEQCDDDNTVNFDGCSAGCSIEDGYFCQNFFDQPSNCFVLCGDGELVGLEECDDGNTNPGDGCSASCTVEAGWACSTFANPSCFFTCGNNETNQAEECDDGNNLDGDGCSSICRAEHGFTCTFISEMPATCFSTCGDHFVASDEMCDDGNLINSDGCDANCTVEPGWICNGIITSVCQFCGNGIVEGTEDCDGTSTCSSNCTNLATFTLPITTTSEPLGPEPAAEFPLSTAAIAGISIGFACCLCFSCAIIFFVWSISRNKRTYKKSGHLSESEVNLVDN